MKKILKIKAILKSLNELHDAYAAHISSLNDASSEANALTVNFVNSLRTEINYYEIELMKEQKRTFEIEPDSLALVKELLELMVNRRDLNMQQITITYNEKSIGLDAEVKYNETNKEHAFIGFARNKLQEVKIVPNEDWSYAAAAETNSEKLKHYSGASSFSYASAIKNTTTGHAGSAFPPSETGAAKNILFNPDKELRNWIKREYAQGTKEFSTKWPDLPTGDKLYIRPNKQTTLFELVGFNLLTEEFPLHHFLYAASRKLLDKFEVLRNVHDELFLYPVKVQKDYNYPPIKL